MYPLHILKRLVPVTGIATTNLFRFAVTGPRGTSRIAYLAYLLRSRQAAKVGRGLRHFLADIERATFAVALAYSLHELFPFTHARQRRGSPRGGTRPVACLTPLRSPSLAVNQNAVFLQT